MVSFQTESPDTCFGGCADYGSCYLVSSYMGPKCGCVENGEAKVGYVDVEEAVSTLFLL